MGGLEGEARGGGEGVDPLRSLYLFFLFVSFIFIFIFVFISCFPVFLFSCFYFFFPSHRKGGVWGCIDMI